MDKKTIPQWEEEKNKMIEKVDSLDLTELMDEERFDALCAEYMSRGVDATFRKKWLADNRYEDTRENRMNWNLPTRTKEEIKAIDEEKK